MVLHPLLRLFGISAALSFWCVTVLLDRLQQTGPQIAAIAPMVRTPARVPAMPRRIAPTDQPVPQIPRAFPMPSVSRPAAEVPPPWFWEWPTAEPAPPPYRPVTCDAEAMRWEGRDCP